jgi:hypothetical protein
MSINESIMAVMIELQYTYYSYYRDGNQIRFYIRIISHDHDFTFKNTSNLL